MINSATQTYVARHNVQLYRRLLADQPDVARRKLLEDLLADEMVKMRDGDAVPHGGLGRAAIGAS